MKIWTSTVQGYRGPDKLDISVKSGDKVFAPTWGMVMGYKKGALNKDSYREQYVALMRRSLQASTERWEEVVRMEEVTLCCWCTPGQFCHRIILAQLLAAYGRSIGIHVEVCGERK